MRVVGHGVAHLPDVDEGSVVHGKGNALIAALVAAVGTGRFPFLREKPGTPRQFIAHGPLLVLRLRAKDLVQCGHKTIPQLSEDQGTLHGVDQLD